MAEGEVVLAFGTVDGIAHIRADQLIIDPQGLKDLDSSIKWKAGRLAIVGNRSEILTLDETEGDIEECAYRLLQRYSADCIVAKCGAIGSMVMDSSGSSWVAAFPSTHVNPIGSGDVFSAVFAQQWAERRVPAKDAARMASQATSVYVSLGPIQVLTEIGELITGEIGIEAPVRHVQVYLAGPFSGLSKRWLVNLCRSALSDLGAEVFSPLHDVGFGPEKEVAPADILRLNEANSMLALLDGTGSGTMYEIGYAAAKGIPVVGFCSSGPSADLTMVSGTNTPIYADLSTSIYNAIWAGLKYVPQPD